MNLAYTVFAGIDSLGGVAESALCPCQTNSDLKLVDGVPVDMWMDENGVQQIEVADGGTTATVIALVDGATLIYAQEPTFACSLLASATGNAFHLYLLSWAPN